MSNFKRNLGIIFDETTNGKGASRRYIAKAFSSAGPGWGVFDVDCDRYLSDGEVSALSQDDIRVPRAVALN